MSSQTSDKELESIVRKCSSVKLSIELARAQSALDSEAIDLLTRAQLVSYICHLRRLAGQNEPVRDIVQDFDITKVIFLPEVDSTVRPRTPTAATAPGFEFFTAWQNGQDRKEAEDRRLAAERAEKKEQRAAKKLEMHKTKEAKERKLAADALEKKEQKEAEERKLAADALEKKEQRAAKKLERQEKKEAKERKRTAKMLKKQRKRDAKDRKRRDDMQTANMARLDKIEADRIAHENKMEADRLAQELKVEADRLAHENKLDRDAAKREDDRLVEARQIRADELVRACNEKIAMENRRIAENSRYEVRLEKAYRTLWGQIQRMPDDHQGVILFLKNLEDIFFASQIDEDLRAAILSQNLNEKARNAHAKFSVEIKTDFQLLKQALLKNFRVTANSCLRDFKTAYKQVHESYEQFSDRLRAIFVSYLHSRNVTNLQDLIELNLSDRFKDLLTLVQKGHVGDLEQERWFTIDHMSKVMDNYVINHPQPMTSYAGTNQNRFNNFNRSSAGIHPRYPHSGQFNRTPASTVPAVRGFVYPPCPGCGMTNHPLARCFKTQSGQARQAGGVPSKPNFSSITKVQPKPSIGARSISRPFKTNVVTIEDPYDKFDQSAYDDYGQEYAFEGDDVTQEETDNHEDTNTYDEGTNQVEEVDNGNPSATAAPRELAMHKISVSVPVIKKDPGQFVSIDTGFKTV